MHVLKGDKQSNQSGSSAKHFFLAVDNLNANLPRVKFGYLKPVS
jgi:hypothetical protein